MIEWLVQSLADHPDLARGAAPDGLLAPAEQARLAALKTTKRRQDWLLGRWTAKRLAQAAIERQTGLRVALNRLAIAPDPDGAPYMEYLSPDGRAERLALHLSISHSNGRALCAICEYMKTRLRKPPGPSRFEMGKASDFRSLTAGGLGADIEQIEERGLEFMAQYFTPEEIEQAQQAEAPLRSIIVTAMWSAKESALKAIRHGLRVDTRCIACMPNMEGTRSGNWSPMGIQCVPGVAEGETFQGWWRIKNGYVLTLAVAYHNDSAMV